MLRKGLVFVVLLAVLGSAGLAGCSSTEQDVVETARDDSRFETLVTALEAADLDETLKGEGPYTVFAPTDDAFDKLPAGTLDALMSDIPALPNILLYHVVDGEVMEADLRNLTSATTLSDEVIAVSVADDEVKVNNALVVEADIECTNGVIHVIDTVLLPPGDIVDVALSDGRFATLAGALQVTDMIEALVSEGPYTVFAPSDEAFEKLPEGTVETLLADIPVLTNVLLYHVVSGELTKADLMQLDSVTTLSGGTIIISATDDTVMVNGAQVIETDIQCTNGVIHIIDTVMSPSQ